MMDWTDRHCRFFHRLLSRRARLYTEMVTTGAVLHGPREKLLGFGPEEHPVALQLGGSDPADLARAARIGAEEGYDEINLNVGCPSDRVQDGRFGACLMREPALVGECVAAMKATVRVPVTVKCRIGVDDQDPEEALDRLAEAATRAGVDALVVHAAKAWLQGLSPKENRDVPPLDYDRVRRLKASRPTLPVVLNGGLRTMEEAKASSRASTASWSAGRPTGSRRCCCAWTPSCSASPRRPRTPSRRLEAFEPYVAARLAEGVRLSAMTRHLLGLFGGRPGARAFRRHLATEAVKPGAGLGTLREAVAHVARPGAALERAA
jgi:tRNA-dihydrouridine synthase A